MHLLRIVPDNTHFDFIRFRRISFPISAVLSIIAITLYFTHGLNFDIDFEEERARIRDEIRSARNEGLFTPPGLRNTIEMPV